MNEFFAKKLESSTADLAILKGVLASAEGLTSPEIKVAIVPLSANVDDALAELEKMLK